MKRSLMTLAVAALVGAAVAVTTTYEELVIQDLGAALNPSDPTNNGFWSLDWTDDQSVRHVHAGVTVRQGTAVMSAPLKRSPLAGKACSADGPNLKEFGMVIIFR